MATTNGNRKILDQKRWDFCTPAPVATAAGMFVASSRGYRQQQLYVTSNTVAYIYRPDEDGWIQIPSPALAGTFGVGACGVGGAFSTGSTIGAASLTATAGTTTTLTTNQTLARDLRGYSVQILAGPNAGQTFVIASNTVGANAVITFTTTAGVAHSASSVYRLITPRWYVLGAGTLAAGSFRVYDFATNTWTTLTITGLPATVGTDGKLISTPSWMDTTYLSFGTGTATSGGASTLTDTIKAWTVNQWANSQIRIVSGTGAGQIRTIASNTATIITTSAAWTANPDGTSVYAISGNDDFLYFLGNNAVTMYRYSISANTWTTLSPSTARLSAPVVGMSAHWVWGATETDWTAENTVKNGRYIYSFRGGATANMDVYDIALNAWQPTAPVVYSPNTEVFGAGTKYTLHGGELYIHKDATGRWFRYSFPRSEMDGWNTMLYTSGAAVAGDTAFDVTYVDGATTIPYVYMVLNTSTVMLRQMVI
jgi:hypothetical protein